MGRHRPSVGAPVSVREVLRASFVEWEAQQPVTRSLSTITLTNLGIDPRMSIETLRSRLMIPTPDGLKVVLAEYKSAASDLDDPYLMGVIAACEDVVDSRYPESDQTPTRCGGSWLCEGDRHDISCDLHGLLHRLRNERRSADEER